MKARALALAASSLAMPAHALPTPPAAERYVVSAVKAGFKTRQRIGARRAGLVCLPAGTFKWSDARAGVTDAKTELAKALHEQAPDIVDAADDPFSDESRYRIVATLDAFTLNACARKWGVAARLAHNHDLSGHGHLTVTWSVFDRTSRSASGPETIDTDFDLPPNVNDAAGALLAGLRVNAIKFARKRWPAAPAQ